MISGLKLLISTVIVLCHMRASTCKNEVSHSLYEYLTSTAIWYVDQVKIFEVEKSFCFSRASCINVNCERSTVFFCLSRGSAYTNRSTFFYSFFVTIFSSVNNMDDWIFEQKVNKITEQQRQRQKNENFMISNLKSFLQCVYGYICLNVAHSLQQQHFFRRSRAMLPRKNVLVTSHYVLCSFFGFFWFVSCELFGERAIKHRLKNERRMEAVERMIGTFSYISCFLLLWNSHAKDIFLSYMRKIVNYCHSNIVDSFIACLRRFLV